MDVEWATVNSEGSLIVGPNSLHSKSVAVITKEKVITYQDWGKHFEDLQLKAGINSSGYMNFESCEWSNLKQKYFFIPKTASNSAYDPITDPNNGSSVILSASSDFKTIEVNTLLYYY